MLALLLALLLAQTPEPAKPESTAARPAGEHGLGEEVITGKAEVRITDSKIFFSPRIDPFSPVNELLVPESYVFDDALYRTTDSMTIPHHFIHSSFLRVPVERDLVYGDIVVFLPSFVSQVAKWELVVANSLGETVRRVVRKGQPPAVITWDGRTDDGEMIVTGEVYSFTFNAYDAHGNITRTPVAPQRVNGLVYRQGDDWVISIAADLVFAEGSAQLLEDASRRLDEAANIIKREYHKEVVAYLYSEHEQLSSARCGVVLDEIKARAVLPNGALKVAPRFIPGLKPKFSKIEIHVR